MYVCNACIYVYMYIQYIYVHICVYTVYTANIYTFLVNI